MTNVKPAAIMNEDNWFCAALKIERDGKSVTVLVPGDAGRPFRSKASALKYAKAALASFAHDPKFASRMAAAYL